MTLRVGLLKAAPFGFSGPGDEVGCGRLRSPALFSKIILVTLFGP